MTPEEALALARAAAAARPAEHEGTLSLDAAPADDAPERLLEWAVIEPDLTRVYSTRRLGAPLTAAKRTLIRALHQYLADALAQQSRFNVLVATRLLALEERVRALEERRER